MNTGIKFYDNRSSDRVIGVMYKNGIIERITFMQGEFDLYTTKSVLEDILEESNTHLLEIFNRLQKKKYNLSFEQLLDKACDLYCDAFIFQLDF